MKYLSYLLEAVHLLFLLFCFLLIFIAILPAIILEKTC